MGTKDFSLVDGFDYSSKGMKCNDSLYSPATMVRLLQSDETNYWIYAANNYAKLVVRPERANSLDLWVEIALDKWLEKVSPKPAKLLEEVPVLR